MKQLSDYIKDINSRGIQASRSPERISFGTRDQCEIMFRKAFLSTDGTVTESSFQWLPEYNEIVDWMTDNKGKGLYLTGDIGRGKSNIISFVIPLIYFVRFNKVLKGFHSNKMAANEAFFTNPKVSRWFLDELGRERTEPGYGQPYEPFNVLIDDAESRLKLIFISTNLSSKDIVDRYDSRTLDRIERLCRIVRFDGRSYRV